MIHEQLAELGGYELLDSGISSFGPARLERFGEYILARPDPQAIWQRSLPESQWQKADALFIKRGVLGAEGEQAGRWQVNNKKIPEKWLMNFEFGSGSMSSATQKISFYAKLNPFKHTGVFPEQAANWHFIAEHVTAAQNRHPERKLKFLNLFGYTGISSVLAAKLGCEVTHVDASKPSLSSAKENMLASGLPEDAIRWILDDASKFVKREVKRGNKYDCILLDPPVFGRGSKGEVWKFSADLPGLLQNLQQICTADFEFVIVNAYAVSSSSLQLKNLLDDFARATRQVKIVDYGELVLKQKSDPKRVLSTGIFARLH